MKCVIPSQNVKILARALHSLCRIGDDLFVEPQSNLLALRTVNMAQSAYAVFTFFECFFSSFNVSISNNDDDDDGCLKCKISMKSCLSVFKSPTCMDKLVEWCQIRLEPEGTQLVFKIRYTHGTTKTHFIPVLENEALHANYGKNNTANRLCITPKVLSTSLKIFPPSIDEITLTVSPEKAILKTHIDNCDSNKSVRSELCLFAGEFEAFTVGVNTSVTFCLKELKAVLAFAEPTNLPILFNFDTHGRPIVFIINNSGVYEANYVVSTLNVNPNLITTSQRTETSITIERNNEKNKRKRGHGASESEDIDSEPVRNNSVNNKSKRLINGEKSLCNVGSKRTNVTLKENQTSRVANLDIPSTSVCDLTGVGQLSLEEAMGGDDLPVSPVPTVVRTVFSRCFNETFHRRNLPGYDKVLVYDSDGMEDSD